MKFLTVLVLSLMTPFLCGCGTAKNNDSSKMIDVAGHKLYLASSGVGTPPVVLESGGGDCGSNGSWQKVIASIKEKTQIAVYDRAGLGRSEPGPEPRDYRHIAEDLHTLLQNAGLRPPFILVGHSMGGLHIQVFAANYPSEVAGMVFVDPEPKEFLVHLSPEEMAAELAKRKLQASRPVPEPKRQA